jgi:Phosphatidylinositol 3- and 4-kinase/FATC domain
VADTGGASRGRGNRTKRMRTDALNVVSSAVRDPRVRAALTFFTRREAASGVRGGSADAGGGDSDADVAGAPLSWTELAAELLLGTAEAAEEASRAKIQAPCAFAVDHVRCFRATVKFALSSAPDGVLREVFLGFLKNAATWLSDPKLTPLMDDVWPCVQELVEVPGLRALLIASYVKFWVEACFQQLAERGPYYRRDLTPAVSGAARRVLVLIATETPTCDVLLLKSSTMPQAFAFILQRACLLLELARDMPLNRQREVESSALAAMAVIMTDRALELDASSAITLIMRVGTPAAVACWNERRHRSNALAFVRALVRVAPPNVLPGLSSEYGLIRARVIADLAAINGGMVSRLTSSQQEPDSHLIDIASSLLSPTEVVASISDHSVASTGASAVPMSAPLATAWLRILYASMSRRDDHSLQVVMHAVNSVLSVFKIVGGDKRALPVDCARWVCRVILEAASIASGLLLACRKPSRSYELPLTETHLPPSAELWHRVYIYLVRQLSRGRIASSWSRSTQLVETEIDVLNTMASLLTLGLVSGQNAASAATMGSSGGRFMSSDFDSGAGTASESLWSLVMFDTISHSSDAVLGFLRTHVAVAGFEDGDGGMRRVRLVRMLCNSCNPRALLDSMTPRVSVSSLANAASAALGLIRGYCRAEREDKRSAIASASKVVRHMKSVHILDALRAMYMHPDSVAGSDSVQQTHCLRFVRASLERVVFPAGGGWSDQFLLGERDLVTCVEQRQQGRQKGTRESIDKRVVQRLEFLLASTLGRFCKLLEILDAKESKPSGEGKLTGVSASHQCAGVNDGGGVRHNRPVPVQDSLDHSAMPVTARRGQRSSAYMDDDDDVVASRDKMDEHSGDADEFNDGTPNEETEGVAEEADDFDAFLNDDNFDPSCHPTAPPIGLSSVLAAQAACYLVTFLGEYLAEGIHLGVFAMTMRAEGGSNDTDDMSDAAKSESKLVSIMLHTAARLAATPMQIVMSSTVAGELAPAISACSRVVEAVRTRDQAGAPVRAESTPQKMGLELTESTQSLVDTVLEYLCSILVQWNKETIESVKLAIAPINRVEARGTKRRHENTGLRQQRGRRPPTISKRARMSDKNKRSFIIDDDDVKQIIAADVGSDDDWSFSPAKTTQTRSQALPVSAVTTPASGPDALNLAADFADEGGADQSSASDTVMNHHLRSVQCATRSLMSVIAVLPQMADRIVDRLENCLKTLASVESVLSPDDNHRDMVVSETIGASYVAIHAQIWDVLLAAGSVGGAEAAGTDILFVTRKWSGIQALSLRLTASYVTEYGYKKRHTCPMPLFVETMRQTALAYLTKYLESCLGIGMAERHGRSWVTPTTRRKKLVRGVLAVAEQLHECNPGNMPRDSRILLLRLAVTALEVVFGPQAGDVLDTNVGVLAGEASDGAGDVGCKQLYALMQEMLDDADGRVRLAAAGLSPVLLRSSAHANASQTSLRDSVLNMLPDVLACREETTRQRYEIFEDTEHKGFECNDGRIVDDDRSIVGDDLAQQMKNARFKNRAVFASQPVSGDSSSRHTIEATDPAWDLTDAEEDTATHIHAAFESTGASFCGSCVHVALTEIAALSPGDRGHAIFELLVRASDDAGNANIAYGGLIRISCRAGYRDPDVLFRAHARLIFAQWVGGNDTATQRPLTSFPVRLVLPDKRNREGGVYDWLRSHIDEVLPLVLASDNPKTLGSSQALAESLRLDLSTLIDENICAVLRVYMMHFMDSTNNKGAALMAEIERFRQSGSLPNDVNASGKLDEALCALLMSTSSGPVSLVTRENYNVKCHDLEFRRDCVNVKPPEFDPMVCALALNRLSGKSVDDSSVAETLGQENLVGSIFVDIQTGTINLDNIATRLDKKPVTLARMLACILQGMIGPPGPPSMQSRSNAYMALGMLYRVNKTALLKETTLRFALFDLIVCGFQYPETARNAKWLMQDVIVQYTVVNNTAVEKFTCVSLLDSFFFGVMRKPDMAPLKELMTLNDKDQRWWELLEFIVPNLLSIVGHGGQDPIAEHARRAIRQLLVGAKEQHATAAIALLDAFPDGKDFKSARLIHEEAYSNFITCQDLTPRRLVEYHLWRFANRRCSFIKQPTATLARLRNLRIIISKHFVVLEDCLTKRSSSLMTMAASSALATLVSIVDAFTRREEQGDCIVDGISTTQYNFLDQSLISSSGSSVHSVVSQVKEEAIQCIGILGSLCTAQVTDDHDDAQFMAKKSFIDCQLALRLLCVELRSESAVSRRVAIDSLVALLASTEGKKAIKDANDLEDEFAMFADTARRDAKRKNASMIPDRLDPIKGGKVTDLLPELTEEGLWNTSSNARGQRNGGDGVPGVWVRLLCATLSKYCDAKGPLHILQAACYASTRFSCEMFPYLLYDVVETHHTSEVNLVAGLSRCIQSQILDNRDVSTGALRLVISGIDLLCGLELERLKSKGVGRSYFATGGKKRTTLPDQLYVLTIPYLHAARAANRCGAYYSAIRFATLHVDSACIQRERERMYSQASQSPSYSDDVNEARVAARAEAGLVLSNALRHIHEPDGPRAVSQSESLLASTAVIASVESNWPRMLGTYDALEGLSECQPPLTRCRGIQTVSFARERDIIRSMVGLGALHSIVKYWHGLRHQVVSSQDFADSKLSSVVGADDDQNDIELEAAVDLVELRYQAAWKLGSWESPPVLTVQSCAVSTEQYGVGLHEAIHISLQALSSGDVHGALACVADARYAISRRMTFGRSGSLAMSVTDAARALRLIDDVALAATVLAQSQQDVMRRSSRAIASSSSIAIGGFSRDSAASEVMRAGLLFKELKDDLGIESINHQQQNVGLPGEWLAEQNPVFAGFNVLDSIWRCRDRPGIYSRRAAGREVPTATGSVEMTLSLRLALARSLGVTQCLARMSADLAWAVLISDGVGKQAWSRAAGALGSYESSAVDHASPRDLAAWHLAEARLRWQSGEGGSSKQEALRAVKRIVEVELGGIMAILPSEETSNVPNFQYEWSAYEGIGHHADRAEDVATLRAEACYLVSMWSASMCAEDPMALFKGYLNMGLAAFPRADQSIGKCNATYTMAEFADSQLTSIDKYRTTKEYAFTVQSVHKTTRMVRKLEAKLASNKIGGRQLQAVEKYVRDAEEELSRNNDKLDRMANLYREWQLLAAKHYADCLCAGNLHDVRAAFRLVSLWMDGGRRSQEINGVLVVKLDTGRKGRLTLGDKSLAVPPNKLLPLAPQLASRLSASRGDDFESSLSVVFGKMTMAHPSHCLWLLIALSNSTRTPPSNIAHGALYLGDSEKKDAADAILELVKRSRCDVVVQTLKLADYYFGVSEIPKSLRKGQVSLQLSSQPNIPNAADLANVVVPTLALPLHGFESGTSLPYVVRFESNARVLGGKSSPLRISCIGSDGIVYPQVVKYEDDMRQDAVMQQLFAILNELLTSSPASSCRNLIVRTYRVVPLSPFAGFLQFVRDSQALRDYLVGDGSPGGSSEQAAHVRYRPHDLKYNNILADAFKLRAKPMAVRVRYWRKIWPHFQPVMRYFFLERFPNPSEWFAKRLAYTRSAAVMSIVGWIIGLGDRHLSNILVDTRTAELIHIDFGIAFETGKLLPTPEHMPFRLTRDVVDGMGIDGVEGVFRKCCEVTLEIMRENKDLVMMVCEVFLHDPLYNWSLSPLKIIQDQLQKDDRVVDLEDENDIYEDSAENSAGDGAAAAQGVEDLEEENGNDKAQQALTRVSEKLDGLELTERLSVEAHVARLIDQARSFDVLSTVYCGWSPMV